jgi:hypothetical protein
MNKKILVLFLFVAIVSMSTACAFDFNDLFNPSSNDSAGENVTIYGIDFNIPDGFSEVTNESIDNEADDNPYVDYNISSKTYANTQGDVIMISASSSDISANDSFAKDASEGGNKATINGVDGYTFSDSGFEGFTFAKDGKLVIISVSDKQLLNDVVVA